MTNATIDIPDTFGVLAQESGGVTCEIAEEFCSSGDCSPETCTKFAEGISKPCGCEASKTVVDEENPGSSDDGGGSKMLQCSICASDGSFNFNMKKPEGFIVVPEGITVADVAGPDTTCSVVEDKCQTGFCSSETCAAFERNGANEVCGCEIN